MPPPPSTPPTSMAGRAGGGGDEYGLITPPDHPRSARRRTPLAERGWLENRCRVIRRRPAKIWREKRVRRDEHVRHRALFILLSTPSIHRLCRCCGLLACGLSRRLELSPRRMAERNCHALRALFNPADATNCAACDMKLATAPPALAAPPESRSRRRRPDGATTVQWRRWTSTLSAPPSPPLAAPPPAD